MPTSREKTRLRLIVTCEHGGNQVPASYEVHFRKHGELLDSHRGYDPGALPLADAIARRFDAHLIYSEITRLLVDLNRSPRNARVFSPITAKLDDGLKLILLHRYHRPHRTLVEQTIGRLIEHGATVLHLGVHSFTPVLDGVTRNADIGLLYDPARTREADFCERWRRVMREADPDARVRMNYPYLGKADGLTTTLRRTFPAVKYLGVELEMNHGLINKRNRFPARWTRLVLETLKTAMR